MADSVQNVPQSPGACLLDRRRLPQQKESAPAETEALEELTAEESAWIAKWLDRSPDWSAEKWDRMGNALGVKFS